MIAGLEAISGGTVEIGNRTVNDIHPKDRDIAMVFQNYALYPHMTVYKNLAFALALRKTPREEIQRRVAEAARILGIEDYLERKPKQLSGGQRQRVALGRAIVRDPAVFLFDEPLSNLDAKLRATTRTEIKALHQRLKTTTIYVTHDQEEAMTLGDRIVVMSAGRDTGVVEQVDSPLNIFRRPVNRFVGAFLGSPPMNFIEGTLQREQHSGLIRFHNQHDDIDVTFAAAATPRLEQHLEQPIALGIRPASLSEHPHPPAANPEQNTGSANTIRIRADIIEPLGRSVDISSTLPSGAHFIARIDPRTDPAKDFKVGETLNLNMDMQHVHVFAPGDFGENLLHPPDPATIPTPDLVPAGPATPQHAAN